MTRHRQSLIAGVGLLAVAFAASYAQAAEQAISGKKLLLKATNSGGRLVVLSKDPSISILGSDPIGGAGASSILFNDGNGWEGFGLPQSLWSANSSGTVFKFKNPDAPGGASEVKVARVKAGLLKVVAKGLPFAVPNGPATIDVVLDLDRGTNSYCMNFSGTGDGNKFLVKDATAGPCPPLLPWSRACCEGVFGGCAGLEVQECESYGGDPVAGAVVCDASGSCVPPPGTPGGCCQIGGVGAGGCAAPSTPVSCGFGGTFFPSAICLPSGACM